MARNSSRKTATPAPIVETEDSSLSREPSVVQAAAVPDIPPPKQERISRPAPETHPHLFDEFGNPK